MKFLIALLAALALVGCGKDAPAPAPEKQLSDYEIDRKACHEDAEEVGAEAKADMREDVEQLWYQTCMNQRGY